MNEGIFIAASGGMKQQLKLEVISNNLANLNTPGFKKDEIVFESLVLPFFQEKHPGNEIPAVLQESNLNTRGAYVGISGSTTDFSQGALVVTTNTLNVALEGEGFFVIETAEGIRYTRNGSFQLDGLGQLVTKDNHLVLGDTGSPIVMDAQGKSITIDADGFISIGNGLGTTPVGKIKLVRFEDHSLMIKEGAGYFRMSDPDAIEIFPDEVIVRQGFLESSNVQPVEEMIKMIETVRVFEAYQKIIQIIDEADNQSISNISQVA